MYMKEANYTMEKVNDEYKLKEVVGLDVQSAVPGSYSQSESPSLRASFTNALL